MPNSVGRVIAAVIGYLVMQRLIAAPLIEDNSRRSAATTLVNLGGYARHGRARLGVELLNLLNSRANDITYFYTSRLPGEPAAGIDDEHLHPVEPREVRVSTSLTF